MGHLPNILRSTQLRSAVFITVLGRGVDRLGVDRFGQDASEPAERGACSLSGQKAPRLEPSTFKGHPEE